MNNQSNYKELLDSIDIIIATSKLLDYEVTKNYNNSSKQTEHKISIYLPNQKRRPHITIKLTLWKEDSTTSLITISNRKHTAMISSASHQQKLNHLNKLLQKL